MSDTVLFDFGGVVIKTPFELVDTDWRGPFDTATDPLWLQSQTGVISERHYWDTRAREFHPDAADPTFAFMRGLYDVDEARIVRPEVVALLDELQAAGHRTAVLTNDLAAFHPEEWIDRMTVIRRFSPVIDLSHVGFLKPSAEAFEHACKELGATPDHIVFLDDQKQNVAGALDAGLRAVWFDPTDVAGSLDRLRDAL
jgi:putative hydrolase of the HAD superfamily